MKKAFEKYISDSYENGEFNAPKIELVGEINADNIGNKRTNSFAVVRDKIGDTAMAEIISPDMTITNLNDGELIHNRLTNGSGFVIDKDEPNLQTGWDSDGVTSTVPINNTPVPLDHIGMEAQRTIEEWRKDNPEQ